MEDTCTSLSNKFPTRPFHAWEEVGQAGPGPFVHTKPSEASFGAIVIEDADESNAPLARLCTKCGSPVAAGGSFACASCESLTARS